MTVSSVVNNFVNKFMHHLNQVLMDDDTRHFIAHCRKAWSKKADVKDDATVLMYYCNIPLIIISDSYFTNLLAAKHKARIVAFSSTRKGFPWSLYYWKRDRVYRSFNVCQFIGTQLNQEQCQRQQDIVDDFLERFKSKSDLFNWEINGVGIGVDIYESYLRVCAKPTADPKDPQLIKMIELGVSIFIFWEDYIKKNNIKAVVVSHDVYIYENILNRLCYVHQIPVYLPNVIGGCRANQPYSIYDPLFKRYPAMFKELTQKEQEEGLRIAERQLQRRLGGEVGVDMPYAIKSAFIKSASTTQRVLRESNKIKALICSHCFYDNPQAYGKMLFPDFYEWICFLGEMTLKTDYDWYIKMHPDPLPGTEEIIRSIIVKYPKITFVPPSTSHIQMIAEGLNFVFTVYGSVGHELAALGIPVVNAGYNPHSGFDFNWHPKTLKEYEEYILDLPKLKKEIRIKDIYAFYYMHYYYTIADSLFLKSYREFITIKPKEANKANFAYKYFLDHLTDIKHQDICRELVKFIDSGKKYYFSRGPQD